VEPNSWDKIVLLHGPGDVPMLVFDGLDLSVGDALVIGGVTLLCVAENVAIPALDAAFGGIVTRTQVGAAVAGSLLIIVDPHVLDDVLNSERTRL